MSDLLFGELDGPRAGALRWIFPRDQLLDVWEWKAFNAPKWKSALLNTVMRKARLDFPDAEVRPRVPNT